jgi:hypothetical protein
LAKQSKWFTHGRSLRIPDLEALGLKIVDFSKDAALNDAIMRYAVLLRMTFENGPVYKIYETPDATIAKRFLVPALNPDQAGQLLGQLASAPSIQIGIECNVCRQRTSVQLDFLPGQPLQPGSVRYPDSGKVPCGTCGNVLDVAVPRADIEGKLGKKALTAQPKK